MIKEIIDTKLQEISKRESLESLGDRSKYVGASDVVGCPRKIVMAKLNPVDHENDTLIRFMRGHLAETILAKCFAETNYRWTTQLELVHPQYEFIKAHADFVFHTANFNKIGIVEMKSVSGVPDAPYESWVQQLQFQMGLAKLLYPNAVIKGSVFAIDLNSGKYEEFNGYEPNDIIFNNLVEKAREIFKYVQTRTTVDLPYEIGLLCSFCPFKQTCPAFTGDEQVVSEDVKVMVEKYKSISKSEKELEAQKDALRQEMIEIINEGVLKFDGNKVSVKNVLRKTLDSKALQTAMPEIYGQFLIEKESVYFRVE